MWCFVSLEKNRNMKNKKDLVFEKLINDANDWIIDHYNATHKPSGISWWIANGLMFFKIESNSSVNIGIVNTIKLYYWLKNAKNEQFLS